MLGLRLKITPTMRYNDVWKNVFISKTLESANNGIRGTIPPLQT